MKEYVRFPTLLAFMSYQSRAWLVELPSVEKIDASSESSKDPLLDSLTHAEKVRFRAVFAPRNLGIVRKSPEPFKFSAFPKRPAVK